MNILHIDSSILGEYSASRSLTAAIAAKFKADAPSAKLIYRDLVENGAPQLTGPLAMFDTIPPDQQSATLKSDAGERLAVLNEVLAADVIIIGAPMYNFAIPSQLKAWIDAITLAGKTFSYDANGPKGLLGDKRVIVASTRGNMYDGTAYAAFDHQETYLRSLFGFLGVTRFEVVRAEGLKISDEKKKLSMESGLRHAADLAVV